MALQLHFRYLPVLKAQRDWGLFLTDCGYSVIEPGSPYPLQQHPDPYNFDWKKGRTLAEYQVVYITRGRGVFETKGLRRQTIEAGDVFVLFPGVWHRYTPDARTGWDEQWVGFNGVIAERLLRAPFFRPKKPVFRIGVDEALRQRFVALVNAVERDPAGGPFQTPVTLSGFWDTFRSGCKGAARRNTFRASSAKRRIASCNGLRTPSTSLRLRAGWA